MRTLLSGVLLASLTLTACSSGDAEAEQAADRLAAGLAEGTLPADTVTAEDGATPQDDYEDLLAGVVGATVDGEELPRPEVEVADLVVEDGTAEVDLRWTWDLGDEPWTYTTSATLTDGEGEGEAGWTTPWAPTLVEPSLTESETLRLRRLDPARGEILGAGGSALVTERPVVRIGIDKTKVAGPAAVRSARALAAAVDLAPGPYARTVKAAGEKAFVEAIVLREDDAALVEARLDGIKGVLAIADRLALAPTREFAAPILGRVGSATAEIVEESEGRIQAGDVVGVSGLQARYDEQLTGTPGLEVVAEDEDESRSLWRQDPVDGEPLKTTLDVDLQLAAERILATLGPDAPAAALVAVRPKDGAIVAAANGEGTDGLNAATFGQYAPGSTFKVVTALALLRSGLEPSSQVSCPTSVVVDGKRFENYDDYPSSGLGQITLREAFANSCNTAFIGARNRLKEGDLADAAAALGLGVDFDLGFPAYFGQVPPAESETGAAAALIGQGKVLSSPMAMAAVAASANAGRTVVPHLLADQAPTASPSKPLTTAEADALRTLMRAVVTEGSGRLLAGIPGVVGAKTGTAEYGEPRPDGSLATHAWMLGVRKDLAVAVFVADGDSGSSTAGPLLRAFLAR